MTTTAFTNSVTLTDAAWFNDVDTAAYSALSSVSGADTITAAGPASMTAYAAGQLFKFVSAGANTGAVTLNITPSGGSALGAKAVTKRGSTALAAGEIASGMLCLVVYDGTRFQLIGAIGGPASVTTLAASGTASMNITNIAANVAGLMFNFANANAAPLGGIIQFSGGAPNDTSQYFLRFLDTSADRCYVYSNGNIVNTNNSYGAISDAKLKQDIQDAPSYWEKLKALSKLWVKGRLKSDPNGELLLFQVAQDVEAISPGLVQESDDYEDVVIEGEDGKPVNTRVPLGTKTKSIKYSVEYAMVAKEFGAALERIEELESRVSQLESNP